MLTEKIFGAAIDIHRAIGSGLLESAYQEYLFFELKPVEYFSDVHSAQILTYMKLGNYPLGLLINFHMKVLKNGIKRFINTPQ
jgi:hypothetical protein